MREREKGKENVSFLLSRQSLMSFPIKEKKRKKWRRRNERNENEINLCIKLFVFVRV